MPGSSTMRRVFVDPARVNLRKAARATLVVPLVFAFLVVVGDTPSALFGSFGAFGALVFADFGGALRRRFAAYLGLLAVGALLIALGSAFADTVYPAVVVMLVVAFAVSFAGALGGYFAAGSTAATLAFVLSVMEPAVSANLGSRELGWVVGVGVSAVAAVALWPVHQRDRVRAAAATVLREVAGALDTPAATRDLSTARTAAAALDERAGVVYRPAGSITRERALVALVIAVRRLVPLLEQMAAAESSRGADTLPEYTSLSGYAASTLSASARVLTGESVDPVDVSALDDARARHTRALERWTAARLADDGAAHVIDRFDAAFPLRRLSFAAVGIAGNASLAAHHVVRTPRDGAAALARAGALLRAHCNLRSVRFRNASRAGLGLALAVLVAKTTSVVHEFWVVLGALAVLRSNALGTGATALQALAGALLGFGVASAVLVTIGGDDTVLWILLPLVVFLAAYTPGAVNFVVGQASFTVFVVVLFNILAPDGWRTGLVRVQDVAIGAGISVAVGALLWPRGAGGVARRAFAELLRAGCDHVRLALGATLDGRPSADAVRAGVVAADARDRAVAALEDLALEHGGGSVDRQTWGALLLDAGLLRVAGDGITRAGAAYPVAGGCGSARTALAEEGRSVCTRVDRDADLLERTGAAAAAGAWADAALPVSPSLDACLATHASEGLDGAVGLVWVHEWLSLVTARPR